MNLTRKQHWGAKIHGPQSTLDPVPRLDVPHLAMHSCDSLPKANVIECVECGYVHLDPLPSQEELDAHWDELYASGYLYEQERGQQWYWRCVYLERMWRFDSEPTVNPMPHLLDYGAGVGSFLDAVRREFTFWERHGYEPNDAATAYSRYPYQYVSNPRQGYYDAVHCSLVLEHVLDPLETLRRVNELLVPGGVVCIVVPNEFNRLQRRLYEWGYSPLHPHHVNYFTQESLTKLVEGAGFEVVELTATFPIEALALAGLNYVKHPRLGIIAHWLRMLFETALMLFAGWLKRILYRWFAEKGIGREIELWVRKA